MELLNFIGKLFVKDVVNKGVSLVADDAIDAIDKTINNIETNNTKKRKAKIKKFIAQTVEGHTKLILSQNIYKLKEDFKVYDQNENLRYIVKGKLFSSTHDLSVYDSSGNVKLGQVVQKLISFRGPFSKESHPQDFVLYINGKKIGKIKSTYSSLTSKYKLDFNDWMIEGNFIGNIYKVKNKHKEIMRVEEKFVLNEDLYFLDILSDEDELLCLLIALAIDSSKSSKTQDNKRTKRKKR